MQDHDFVPSTACNPTSILEADSIHNAEEDDWDNEGMSSITSSIMDYEFENGRRYHAYKAGHYPLPNDENELDRLDLQHHVVTLLLNGELHLAPLQNPRKILDLGTGTGLWAIEMGDRFPNAIVTGVDLSPIQPTWIPNNVRFEIDDVESEWLYPENTFDFIHSRIMIGAIEDWPKMMSQAFKHCKPGGFLEIQELNPRLDSDDGTHHNSKWHLDFVHEICGASLKYGKPVPQHTEFKAWLEAAGFVDVRETFFKIPVNTWPKNKQLKEVGKYQLINYSEGYEAISIGLFTRALGWHPAEFQVLLARVRKELKDRNIHAYQPFAVVTGRKPYPDEVFKNASPPPTIPTSLDPNSRDSLRDSVAMPPPPLPTHLVVKKPAPPPPSHTSPFPASPFAPSSSSGPSSAPPAIPPPSDTKLISKMFPSISNLLSRS